MSSMHMMHFNYCYNIWFVYIEGNKLRRDFPGFHLNNLSELLREPLYKATTLTVPGGGGGG